MVSRLESQKVFHSVVAKGPHLVTLMVHESGQLDPEWGGGLASQSAAELAAAAAVSAAGSAAMSAHVQCYC